MLRDDLEERTRVGGRGVHMGGGICILMDESHCPAAETNTTLQTIILQLKIN